MIALFVLVTAAALVMLVILPWHQAHYSQALHHSGIRYSVFSEGPTLESQSVIRMLENLVSIGYSLQK